MKTLILWGICWVLLHSPSRGDETPPEPPSEIPHLVGTLGHSRNIDFEGNATFPTAVLRRALTRDIDYVLASHSSEPLDRFLAVIGERLRLGYLNSGFPGAKVEATRRTAREPEGILVSIVEGPRYRQGTIRVEGDPAIDTAELVKALQTTPDDKGKTSYTDRLRALVKPYGKAPQPSEEHGSFSFLEEMMSSSQDGPTWTHGEPVAFGGDDDQTPMHLQVASCLAEQGRPRAKVTTRHDLRADGTADLVIHVDDAGPATTVGLVTVAGNVTNTPEEIQHLTGLVPGQALTPALLDAARLALWRSGRFFPFAIDMRPRTDEATEVDIHIRAWELENAPPLSTPATREQDVVLRFLDWINSGMAGEELLFEREDPELGRLLLGWVPRDRAIVHFAAPENSTAVSTMLSGEGASLTLHHDDRTHSARIKGSIRNLAAHLHLLPSHDEKRHFSFSAGIGISSKQRGEFFDFDLLVTPAYAFIKAGEIRSEGDRVIVSPAIFPYSIELDAATARPMAVRGKDKDLSQIVTLPGSVRERQRQLEAELARQDADSSAAGWVDAIAAFSEISVANGGTSFFTEAELDSARKGARLIDLLAKPEILDALKKSYSDITAEIRSKSEFTIPVNPEQLGPSTTLALLLGFGYLGLAEEYLPEAEWTGTFAREMMFILGGKTQHSAKVMNTLLADPAIGPCGSVVCAELLDEIDPVTARRFRMKARAQCSAEAFRKDWKLIADSSGPIGRGFDRCLQTIASFSTEDETTANGLLPKDMSAWFRSFLGKLRQHPTGKPWSDLIAPQMDKLWDDALGASLRDELDRRLPPPVDPAEVAATIDDIPVPRYVVQALERARLSPLSALSVPEFDESRPWTRNLALTGAIRMIMLRNSMQQAGRYPSEEAIEEFLTQRFPDLVGKPEADWIRRTGMSRTNFGEWAALAGCAQQLLVDLQTSQEEAPDNEVLRNYYEARAAIYRRNVDTDMLLIRSDQGTPAEVAGSFERAEQLAKLLGSGSSVAELEASGELEKDPVAQAFSRNDASLSSYQFSVMKAIASLKPGEVTKPMEVGSGVAIVVLRATREEEIPRFEEVKESVLEHWRDDEVANHARRWFEEHEAAANIQVPGTPSAPD